MKDFQSYSPESAIEENLRESALRMEMLSEQELSHLRELAVEITADCIRKVGPCNYVYRSASPEDAPSDGESNT